MAYKKELNLLELSGNWALDYLRELSESYKEDKDALDIIADSVASYADYISHVHKMETSILGLRFRLEPEAFRAAVSNLDSTRSLLHNGVIASTKVLNRLAALSNLSPFFSGDISDRLQVADFAKDVVFNVFENRKK